MNGKKIKVSDLWAMRSLFNKDLKDPTVDSVEVPKHIFEFLLDFCEDHICDSCLGNPIKDFPCACYGTGRKSRVLQYFREEFANVSFKD